MPKLDSVEQALDRLAALKSLPADSAFLDELRAFLRNRSNIVVAKAAKIVGQRHLADLLDDLAAAFHKLMADAPRLDKRCAAVTEIVTTLYEMDYSEPDVYRQGLRHVQMEPSFGPLVDAAAQLRGLCAMGLVRSRDRGGDAGALALRLKVLTGDPEPEMLAECFSGLLASPEPQHVGWMPYASRILGSVRVLTFPESGSPLRWALAPTLNLRMPPCRTLPPHSTNSTERHFT